jgi:hypothetical protein
VYGQPAAIFQFWIYIESRKNRFIEIYDTNCKAPEVTHMTRKTTVRAQEVHDVESVKLRWKVARQIQQELLEEKLAQCFLISSEWKDCIGQYPVAMQPMIMDFMRKADEQTRLPKKFTT